MEIMEEYIQLYTNKLGKTKENHIFYWLNCKEK